ncbi:hypothetical protein BJ742DRAFT_741264 [Cladochytrium replicatum]|nr:hypothetical protein BJ742DRAFT_741264 [Cladochytrium replicatum]
MSQSYKGGFGWGCLTSGRHCPLSIVLRFDDIASDFGKAHVVGERFSVAVYTVVTGNELDAATAFSSIQILNTLQGTLQFLQSYFPLAVQGKVAFDRIAEFLDQEDLEKYKCKERVDEVMLEASLWACEVARQTLEFDHATLLHYEQASCSILKVGYRRQILDLFCDILR